MWPFKRRAPEIETRAAGGTSYTSQVLQARADYITGVDGVAEITGTVQGCVSLWEGGMTLANVQGTDLLNPRDLALAARSLALRGEALFVIRGDELLPVESYDLTTQRSKPTAYRISIADIGGGRSEIVLAAEVLHFRTGCSPELPYIGTSHRHQPIAPGEAHGGLAPDAGSRAIRGLQQRAAGVFGGAFSRGFRTGYEPTRRSVQSVSRQNFGPGKCQRHLCGRPGSGQ